MILRLDQGADFSGHETYTLLKVSSVPEFVKTAEADTYGELQALPKTAFADQDHKLYPMNTPARVYVSNCYFQDKRAALLDNWGEEYVKQTEERLNKAAELFDITKDIKAYNDALSMQKQAAEKVAFIEITGKPMGDDFEVVFYKLANQDDYNEAVSRFCKHASNMPISCRREVAEQLLKHASHFSVDELPDYVCKYAGMYYPDHQAVVSEIVRRSDKTSPEDRAEYLKFKTAAEQASSVEDFMKLAADVFNFEVSHGMYALPKKAQLLPDPVDTFFTLSAVKVAEMLDVVKMGDHQYAMPDLQKVSADTYKEAFGIDIDPSDAQQLRDVLPTMPRSDIALFRDLTNVQPI